MRRPPLRDRILSALALAPMTDRELAQCLSAPKTYVEGVRARMLKAGVIGIYGRGERIRKVGVYPHRYVVRRAA